MLSITACSPRPRFVDFAISWTLLSFWIGENVCPARDVKPFLELFDVVHHLLVHVILLVPVSSLEFVILPFLLDSNGVVVRIVSFGLALSDSSSLMMTLFLMLVVLGHLLGHPRMLQICPCNCAEFVALSVVFENLVVLIPHLGVQRLVHTFVIRTLLLLLIFNSSDNPFLGGLLVCFWC